MVHTPGGVHARAFRADMQSRTTSEDRETRESYDRVPDVSPRIPSVSFPLFSPERSSSHGWILSSFILSFFSGLRDVLVATRNLQDDPQRKDR